MDTSYIISQAQRNIFMSKIAFMIVISLWMLPLEILETILSQVLNFQFHNLANFVVFRRSLFNIFEFLLKCLYSFSQIINEIF